MLHFWMRMGRRIRPWILVVALAAAGAGGCYSSEGPAPTDGEPEYDARDVAGDADVRPDADAEVLEDGDARPDADAEALGDGDVPRDGDAEADCIPGSFYGPGPTCETDDDCRREVGECSTCSGSDTWPDGCGGWVGWRWCEPGYGECPGPDADADSPSDADGDCTIASWYGPSPLCESDAECESEHGSGWVCDGYEEYADSCGGTILWGPVCRPPDAPDGGTDSGE
jgi:hypothetical protein